MAFGALAPVDDAAIRGWRDASAIQELYDAQAPDTRAHVSGEVVGLDEAGMLSLLEPRLGAPSDPDDGRARGRHQVS
jgi:hypothetical protein